jgi:DNA polymerase-3 subunit delta'
MKLNALPNHHAVLLIHKDRKTISDALWNELSLSSPAHTYFNHTVLDIDTARAIMSWASTPYNEVRTALITFHIATHQAQNAMLKMLEEPQAHVRFVIVTSNKESLLDTVLSRVVTVGDDESRIPDSVYTFLQTKPALRMKLPEIVALAAREDEEGRKDREAIRQFVLHIVSVLGKEKHIPHTYIQETLRMASYTGDTSTSGKTILEYLSLLLPVCGILS